MKLLWFAWVWSLCNIGTINCLHITLSPHKIFHGLDRIGTGLLLGSLDYLNKSTMKNLPRLLSVEKNFIMSDYYRIKLSKAAANDLVESFINFPKLHPIVLPFPLYSTSKHLQDALALKLDLYWPGTLNCLIGPETIGIKDQDLLAIANHIPNLYVEIGLAKIARQLIEADYETYRDFFELGDWTLDEFNAMERIERYGELFGFISILHTFLNISTIQEQNALRDDLEETLAKATLYFPYFYIYFEHLRSWREEYISLHTKVREECKKLRLRKHKCAFWEGRLLEIFARHKSSQNNEVEKFYLYYLNSYPLESIPHTVLFDLKLNANNKKLLLHFDKKKDDDNAKLVVNYLDTVFALGSGMQDNIASHIDRVYIFNRRINRIKDLHPPPCNPCSTVQLIKWWGDFDDLKSIILVNATTFPTINIKSGYLKKTCQDLSCLLSVIADIFLSFTTISLLTINHSIYEKAFTRTLAYSLFYQSRTSLKLSKSTINLLYGDDVYEDDEYGAGYADCIFRARLLRQVDFDKIPKELFTAEVSDTSFMGNLRW